MLPNILQYPIAMFGALRAGLIVVNVNPLYTADEVAHQVNDAGAETLLVVANFANTVEKALPRIPTVEKYYCHHISAIYFANERLDGEFCTQIYLQKNSSLGIFLMLFHLNQCLQKVKNLTFDPVTITNQDIAFLQYTGGTTGISKGAILTHRNIIANIQQADAWFKVCW